MGTVPIVGVTESNIDWKYIITITTYNWQRRAIIACISALQKNYKNFTYFVLFCPFSVLFCPFMKNLTLIFTFWNMPWRRMISDLSKKSKKFKTYGLY